MKKYTVILTALLLVLLCGCGHQHSWTEATCTEPKVCTECGETEGEPLGHAFAPADCVKPETCSRCGETKGEPLGHGYTEPNYQQSAVCERCGKEGQKLIPAFQREVLPVIDMKPGKDAAAGQRVVTRCYNDTAHTTDGRLMKCLTVLCDEEECETLFKDFDVPVLEGYAWYRIELSIRYFDVNAQRFGMSVGSCNEDFYDIEGHDDSMVWLENFPTHEGRTYPGGSFDIHYYSDTVKGYRWYVSEWTGWKNNEDYYNLSEYYYMPADYDGAVIGFFTETPEAVENGAWAEGTYIYDYADENSLFFRIRP